MKKEVRWSNKASRRVYPSQDSDTDRIWDIDGEETSHFETPTTTQNGLRKSEATRLTTTKRNFDDVFYTEDYIRTQISNALEDSAFGEEKYALRVRDHKLLRYGRYAQKYGFVDLVEWVQELLEK